MKYTPTTMQALTACAGLLGALVTTVVAIGVTWAPWLVDAIVPGFEGARRGLAVQLVRILFPGVGALVNQSVPLSLSFAAASMSGMCSARSGSSRTHRSPVRTTGSTNLLIGRSVRPAPRGSGPTARTGPPPPRRPPRCTGRNRQPRRGR